MAEVYDCILVGDGVAANAVKLELAIRAPELRVLQIAGARNPIRYKVGEHLSAAANIQLKHFGLWDDFLSAGFLEVRSSYSSWGSPLLEERNTWGDSRGSGWSLDRVAFEHWFSQCAKDRSRCSHLSGNVIGVDFSDHAQVSIALAGGDVAQARFVIDASGRASVVARTQTVRRRLDRLTATYNYLEQVDTGIEATAGPMVEACPGGWFYSALLPQRKLIVAWFTDSDLVEKGKGNLSGGQARSAMLKARIEKSDYTLRRIESAGFSLGRFCFEEAITADASTRVNDSAVGEHWAAVGDASAAFDPLASHGLTTALWSGRQVAEAMTGALQGHKDGLREYNTSFLAGVTKLRREFRQHYRAEQRFTDTFWIRRQAESLVAPETV
ncbi:MAG: tryptophan 7-halogenase [Verrucomicrobiota bacterium]